MNYPKKEIVERVRKEYPVGAQVVLVSMNDVHSPPVGTIGKVLHVDDMATVHVAWQNGSTLGAVYGEDVIRKVDDTDA